MKWTIKKEIEGVFTEVETFDDDIEHAGEDDLAAGADLATQRMESLRADQGGCWAVESAHAVPE